MAYRFTVSSNVPPNVKRVGWPFTIAGMLMLVFLFDVPWYGALAAAFLTAFYVDLEFKR